MNWIRKQWLAFFKFQENRKEIISTSIFTNESFLTQTLKPTRNRPLNNHIIPVVQLVSVYPGAHVHVYILMPSVHVPSFSQGLGLHSSISMINQIVNHLLQMLPSNFGRFTLCMNKKRGILMCTAY